MAEFRFTMDINANYDSVNRAKAQMILLNGEIARATDPNNNININAEDLKEAELYARALSRAIDEVERNGGDLNATVGREFQRLRQEAGLAGQQTRQLRRDLEALDAAGARGANGLKRVSTAARIATQDIRRTATQLDRLQVSMREGIGQTIAFGSITAFTGMIASAVQEVKKLDDVMTDISIVSQKSAEQMESYRDSAFNAARALGTTAEQYMKATLIYEQQGGKAADFAQELGKATTIASNITGTSTDEMSEYITATMNGFKMLETEGSNAGMKIVDVYSKLGAVSGSGLEEMAEALQRTATVASDAGYEFEDIASAIATVSETTRRSPEVIGSAFKSILLSFQQLRKAGDDELNAFSNKVEKAFQLSGLEKELSIFDDTGHLRDARDIMVDIGKEWKNLNKESQSLISESIAGKEQAETLRAFFSNQERYNDLLETAYSSAGTAANQQIIYMDSLQAHIEKVKNAWQRAASAIIDTDLFKGILNQAEKFLTIIGSQENAFMALGTAIAPLVGIFGKLFGGKMAADAMRNRVNTNLADNTMKRLEAEGKLTQELKDQLRIAQDEQRIKTNLGEQAAAAYAKNKQEAEALEEELKRIEKLKQNLPETVNEVQDAMNNSGGVQGISSAEYNAARAAAREDLEQNLAMYRQKVQENITKLQVAANQATNIATHRPNSNIQQVRQSLLDINRVIEQSGVETAEVRALQERLSATVNDTTLDYQQMRTELDNINTELNDALRTQQQLNSLNDADFRAQAGDTAANEAGRQNIIEQLGADGHSEEQIRQELDLVNAQNDAMEEGAGQTSKLRATVEGLTMAYGGLMPVIASVNSAMEGQISKSEAIGTSLQSIGMTLTMIPNIYVKIIGLVAMLAGTVTGFIDFRDSVEKATEANEKFLRSFMALSEEAGKSVSALADNEKILKSMKDLDPEVILAGNAIPTNAEKSQQLKQKYLEMANAIAETSPELVKYYDLEGNAVIDLTADYDEFMQKRVTELAENNQLMLSNQEGFITEYSDKLFKARVQVGESEREMAKARELISNGNKTGDLDEVEEGLAKLQEYSTKLSDARTSLKETNGQVRANIIQPLIDSNAELQKLALELPEYAGAIKSTMSEIANTNTISGLLGSGDDEAAQTMLSNVEKMGQVLTDMDEKTGKSLMEKLTATDETMREIVLTSKEMTFDEMKDSLASVKDIGTYLMTNDAFGLPTEEAKEYANNVAEAIAITQNYDIDWLNYDKRDEAAAARQEVLNGLKQDALKTVRKEAKEVGEVLDAEEERVRVNEKLEKTHKGITNDKEAQMEYLTEELQKTNKVRKEYDRILKTLERRNRTAEGYNENLADLKDAKEAGKLLENIKKDFEDNKVSLDTVIDSESFQKLKAEFPEMADSVRLLMDEAESGIDGITEATNRVIDSQQLFKEALVSSSGEYFAEWQRQHAEFVDYAKINYGIDASNYANISEYKQALAELEAAQFEDAEVYKVLATQKGVDERKNADTDETNSFLGNLQTKLTESTAGFNYLSSESLSISDKINVAFLSIIDTFFGMAQAVAGSVSKLVHQMSGWLINDLIGGVLNGYNSFIDKIASKKGFGWAEKFRLDAAEKYIVDRSDENDGRLEKDLERIEGWKNDRGSTYAKNRIELNEATKAHVIQGVGEVDEKAWEAFEKGGGLKKQAVPTPGKGKGATYGSAWRDNFEDPEAGSKGKDPTEERKKKEEAKKKKDAEKKKKEAEKKKKEKEKAKKEEVEDLDLELDRYYKFENQLSVIEKKFSDISRKKEEAYGSDKVKLMEKEQQQYASQVGVLNKYITALQKERAEKQKVLSSAGFTFSASGEISNLNRQLEALQNAANAKKGKAKEKAIERVQELQEEASRYTELQFDMIPDKKQAIAEAKSTIKQIEREKVEYRVELTVQKSEYLQQVRDTIKELNGEAYDRLDENLVVTGQQIKENMKMYDYYEKKVKAVKNNTKLSAADRKELINEYKGAMLDSVTAAKAAYEELASIQGEFINKTKEMIDSSMDGFEKISDKASSLADVYSNVYGVRAYQQVGKMRQIQLDTIDAQMQGAEQLKLQMALYQTTLEKNTDEWKEAQEIIDGLGDKIQESLIARIELLQDAFNEFKENLLEYGDRSVFGSLGLDDYQEQMEKVLDQNDKWFNSFEKITKVGALIAEVNQSIADATDPAQAEAYSKFRDKELQRLLEADKLSTYEFERAQKLWDIEQKKNALEERKNAKRVANLVRDSQGNMTYEYVRQEDGDSSSSSSKKDLADAQAALTEFDQQRVRENATKILSIVADTKSKISQIYDDTSLSEAERDALLNRTMEQAKNEIAEMQKEMIQWSGYSMVDGLQELETAFSQNKISLEGIGIDDATASRLFEALKEGSLQTNDILQNNVNKFAEVLGISSTKAADAISYLLNATGNESSMLTNEMLKLSNQWTKTTESNLKTLKNEYQSTQNAISKSTKALDKVTGNLTTEIKQQTSAAKKNVSQINKQREAMEHARNVANKTTKSFDKLTKELIGKSGSGGTLGAMVDLQKEMNKKLTPATKTVTKAQEALRKKSKETASMLSTLGGKANYAYKQHKLFDSKTITTANANVKTFGERSDTSAKKVETLGKKSDESRKKIASLSTALAALPGLDSDKRYYYTKINKDGSTESVSYKEKKSASSNLKFVGYFADGGPTGRWAGSSGNQTGAHAIVHENEFILNKEDTRNFLDGMAIQRELLKDTGNIEGLYSQLASYSGSTTNNQVDQVVKIEANFPNVSSSREIESALSNLSLRAQSHAFNKNVRKK